MQALVFKFKQTLYFLGVILWLYGCEGKNLGNCEDETPAQDYCTELTEDEKAQKALNEENFSKVVEILQPLVDSNPTEYFRYPILASAYAALGGFDVLAAAEAGTGGDSGSDQSGIEKLLPTPNAATLDTVYLPQLEKIGKARDLVQKVIEEDADLEAYYRSTAEFQLGLYQMVYSLMYLNQFAIPSEDGDSFDPERIAELTVDEAIVIIENLANAQRYATLISGNESAESIDVGAAVGEILDEISNEEGATTDERLRNYLQKKNESSN